MVGGGVTGASALYHLTAAGCQDVLLLERDTLCAGSTSKAAGGICAQFSDELNIRMALENIRRFVLMEKELDHDDGELTATQKVRRGLINAKFARELQIIYGSA